MKLDFKNLDLKSLLKSIKQNESNFSMGLGVLVIIVMALLVFNYFRNLKNQNNILTGANTQQENITLPTKHTVAQGETLWSISEKYYKTGYNWTDIAKANKLKDSNNISVGQELIIPEISQKEVKQPEVAQKPATTSETTAPTPAAVPNPIAGGTYTVVKGDNLWKIAIRAYGDGYKWVQIARENKLKNPNLIHPGNVFTLPR